jgi:hypothetical protein
MQPPPPPKRQNAGWRGLSIDIDTGAAGVYAAAPTSSAHTASASDPAPDARLDGRLVREIWLKSRLEPQRLRNIWCVSRFFLLFTCSLFLILILILI